MKKLTISICLMLISTFGFSQNLVPNGDFEQFLICPTYLTQINHAINWFNPAVYPPGGSPEYFNQCSTNNYCDVPSNSFGYQLAHSGVGYAGLALYYSSYNNFREYIEVPLTSTLISNKMYHFEMYMSLADNSQYTTDAIGIYLSDTIIHGINDYLPLPFTSQINNPLGVYPDITNWTLVSGNYNASGGEKYLLIGNFKDDLNTSPNQFNPGAGWPFAYVFIDDVSLSTSVGVYEESNNALINIYPNPATDNITIETAEKASIEILNIAGQIIKTINTAVKQTSIDVSDLASGVYIIKAKTEKGVAVRKFVKE